MRWGGGEICLRVDGITGDKSDDLAPFICDQFPALLGCEVHLPFLDYLSGNDRELDGMEYFHERFVSGPAPVGGVIEDMESCHGILEVHLFSLLDIDGKVGIYEDLEAFPVTFKPCNNCTVQRDHRCRHPSLLKLFHERGDLFLGHLPEPGVLCLDKPYLNGIDIELPSVAECSPFIPEEQCILSGLHQVCTPLQRPS